MTIYCSRSILFTTYFTAERDKKTQNKPVYQVSLQNYRDLKDYTKILFQVFRGQSTLRAKSLQSLIRIQEQT